MSDMLMQHSFIFGTDYLYSVELNMKEGKVSIREMKNKDEQPNSRRF